MFEGDHVWTQPYRFAFGDTVVFLDFPRGRCLVRAILRALRHRGTSRPGMTEGCMERINKALLRGVWRYRDVERPKDLRHLEDLEAAKQVAVLRTDAEVTAFLAQARSVSAKSPPT